MSLKACCFVLLLIISLSLPVVTSAQGDIAPGTPVEGTFEEDAQIFMVDAVAGQLLIIRMDSDEFDTLVTVQQDGEELASDDDSGGDRNALLAYVAQSDGTFEIVADRAFFEDAGGAFTLHVDIVEPVTIGLGESVVLEPEGGSADQLFAVFKAAAGQVVNVWAATTSDEDLEVALIDVDGAEIEIDDDDGPGRNALLRRVVLNGDGLYLVKVNHSFSDTPLTAGVAVTVEESAQLFLDATPQELVLGDGEGQKGTEVYTVDMVAGTTYRFIVSIEPMPDEDAGVELELLDTDKFFAPFMDSRHATGVVWEYTATQSGPVRLDVHPNFFGQDISVLNYTIALEEIAP